MSKMLVSPKIRGFICTTAHPAGCYSHVKSQIEYVKRQTKLSKGPKNVLVIGSSTGYGLASRIVSAFGFNAKTLGVFFEKPASGKRTASAGWYNSAAFEAEAQKAGIYAKSINGDAFTDELKQEVISCIKQDFAEGIDLIIYSLASPRRTDPKTCEVYNSVLKPIGQTFNDKTVNIMSGEVSNIKIEPATQEEVDQTINVMGGADWDLWINALISANVLAPNAVTIAYSYIGPEITYPIYHHGTIGAAKAHLEQTAKKLNAKLAQHCRGKAMISINKGLVTQASAAIPVVPLYLSLLYKVMKAKNIHEGCIEQIWRLFAEHLYINENNLNIRIDDLELQEDVQAEVAKLWQQVSTDNLEEISDIEGYRQEFYQLFGFNLPDIDYNQEVEVEVPIASILPAPEYIR